MQKQASILENILRGRLEDMTTQCIQLEVMYVELQQENEELKKQIAEMEVSTEK